MAVEDYDALRLFLHLSRTLHFGRTARECHVSPSALSRTIQRLERDLGVRLFARDRRRVELTADGLRFQQYTGEALDRWEAMRRDLRAREELAGTLSIFCTVTASQSILPAALSRFREAHPDVHIQLETGYAADALAMLDDGRVDVTVAALPERLPRTHVAHILITTPLLFVAPTAPCATSRLVERRRVPWDEVPTILPPFGLTRDHAGRWFKDRGVSPPTYAEIQGHEAILSLVSLGCGVGVVPGLVLEKSPLRAAVRPLDVRPALGEFRVGVCTLRRKLQSPLVAALWETVAGYPS